MLNNSRDWIYCLQCRTSTSQSHTWLDEHIICLASFRWDDLANKLDKSTTHTDVNRQTIVKRKKRKSLICKQVVSQQIGTNRIINHASRVCNLDDSTLNKEGELTMVTLVTFRLPSLIFGPPWRSALQLCAISGGTQRVSITRKGSQDWKSGAAVNTTERSRHSFLLFFSVCHVYQPQKGTNNKRPGKRKENEATRLNITLDYKAFKGPRIIEKIVKLNIKMKWEEEEIKKLFKKIIKYKYKWWQ